MSPGEKLALVIPTLNEAECLPRLLHETQTVLNRLGVWYEILVVDDDSEDGSGEIVRQIALKDPRVRLLVRRERRGLAGAVLHGWRQTDAQVLGVMDADLQHPPELLPELLEALARGADVSLASRYVENRVGRGFGALRRLISRISIWLARPLQRPAVRVTDPLSGYFLVRRPCIAGMRFRSVGFKLLLEILTRGRVRCVVEVPFCFGRRGAGSSKAGIGTAWHYGVLLGSLYLTRIKASPVLRASSLD